MIKKTNGPADLVYPVNESTDPLHVTIDNPVGDAELIDEYGALVTIDYAHHRTHAGRMFSFEHSANVTNGNNLDMAIITGAGEDHLVMSIVAGGQCKVYFYEDAVLTNNGTVLAIYNHHRTSTNTEDLRAYHTPTVSDVGTTPLVNGRLLPGGTTVQTRE